MPSFCHKNPGVHQAFIAIPIFHLVITFNWFQNVGSDVLHPMSSLVIAPFATSRSLARTLHLQRWTQRHQGDEPTLDTCATVCQTDIAYR